MEDEEFCYCHHDDTDEYHDCLDYMGCEECPYYYAEEAIELVNIENECVNRAENCNRKCNECDLVQDTNDLLDLYKHIPEWLEELKALSLEHKMPKTNEAIARHVGYETGYNKAIDDLREKLMHSGFIFTQHALNIFDEIAEQLKEGGESDNI